MHYASAPQHLKPVAVSSLWLGPPCSVINWRELASDRHEYANYSADHVNLLWIAKRPRLHAGIRMGDQRQNSILQFTPSACIASPDVGEVRGGEAFELLQLLNTGHSGTLCTIHANSAKQGLARFTSCVLQSGIELPYAAIKANIGDSLNVVVHVERRPGRRFVSEVLEINSYHPDPDLFDYCAVFQKETSKP